MVFLRYNKLQKVVYCKTRTSYPRVISEVLIAVLQVHRMQTGGRRGRGCRRIVPNAVSNMSKEATRLRSEVANSATW